VPNERPIKRRARVATLFPNAASVLRLISAILIEVDEDWTTGRVCLDLTKCQTSSTEPCTTCRESMTPEQRANRSTIIIARTGASAGIGN